ncbi:hypothetical protein JCM33374_g5277 [Metschnikowia sp. JCM 33374]|nr:hypothetical protein JCM33374_g5277 [Metschnikowia sp. JCM 33374]
MRSRLTLMCVILYVAAPVFCHNNPMYFSDHFYFPRNKTQQADMLLEDLLSCLKSFVLVPEFDTAGFEWHADLLQSQISNIDRLVEKLPSINSISLKLDFAKYMFRMMVHSAKQLKMSATNSSANHIFRYIILLKLELLAFFDSYGDPDPQIRGYDKMISGNLKNLQQMKNIFVTLHNLPLRFRFQFDIESNHAQKLLEEMAKFVGKENAE